jgi:hypothetical protein
MTDVAIGLVFFVLVFSAGFLAGATWAALHFDDDKADADWMERDAKDGGHSDR